MAPTGFRNTIQLNKSIVHNLHYIIMYINVDYTAGFGVLYCSIVL